MYLVIQRLTVISNPTRVFEVGTEIDGREVIEIKQVGYEHEGGMFSEFQVLDEKGLLIASTENAPVILDWKVIAVHEEEQACKETLPSAI